MNIVWASSEAVPFAKTGGLADVAGSLPVSMRQRLIGCRVVMPLYESVPQELRDNMQFVTSISVPQTEKGLSFTATATAPSAVSAAFLSASSSYSR